MTYRFKLELNSPSVIGSMMCKECSVRTPCSVSTPSHQKTCCEDNIVRGANCYYFGVIVTTILFIKLRCYYFLLNCYYFRTFWICSFVYDIRCYYFGLTVTIFIERCYYFSMGKVGSSVSRKTTH